MKTITSTLGTLVCALAVFSTAQAETYEITITNGTKGQVITPPVAISHDASVSLFELGKAAPAYLVPLAEDGDSSAFAGADGAMQVHAVHRSDAGIPPGHSQTFSIESGASHNKLSLAAMLASTNDAFIALNGITLASDFETHHYHANVYDAGSEKNSEDCQYIPGPPCGSAGKRDSEGAEGFVTVHNGIHGGASLVPAIHDWRNPGALISIKRTQ